ncbi:transposase [Streptomyces alboflavus]|uniref:Transposase n=1 Tax=Streptomyces alboflavus TaxID=67267 RepID=A0A1Z1WPL9_9ACTN|nr:hypothetical protein [Streptomyces alboflavus]ARX88349.1 transposase [Streptomyces alboflavus]
MPIGQSNASPRQRPARHGEAEAVVPARTEPLPFFRFPYSSTTTASVADVNTIGYAAIESTTDTNGCLGPGRGKTFERVVERAVDAPAPGAIIQMHVGSSTGGVVPDAQAPPRILPWRTVRRGTHFGPRSQAMVAVRDPYFAPDVAPSLTRTAGRPRDTAAARCCRRAGTAGSRRPGGRG